MCLTERRSLRFPLEKKAKTEFEQTFERTTRVETCLEEIWLQSQVFMRKNRGKIHKARTGLFHDVPPMVDSESLRFSPVSN